MSERRGVGHSAPTVSRGRVAAAAGVAAACFALRSHQCQAVPGAEVEGAEVASRCRSCSPPYKDAEDADGRETERDHLGGEHPAELLQLCVVVVAEHPDTPTVTPAVAGGCDLAGVDLSFSSSNAQRVRPDQLHRGSDSPSTNPGALQLRQRRLDGGPLSVLLAHRALAVSHGSGLWRAN